MGLENNIKKIYLARLLKSFMFFAPVAVPFFLEWGKINFIQIMILQSVFIFSSLVFEVPTGALADRFSRKYSLVLSGLVGVIAATLYGLIPNFWVFVFGEIFFGLSYALFSNTDYALAFDSLKVLGKEKQSKNVFARIEAFRYAGVLIAAPLGSLIAVMIALNATFYLMTIPYLFCALIALTITEPKLKVKKEKYLQQIKEGFKLLKANKKLLVLGLDYALYFFLIYYFWWFYQPFLQKTGLPIIYWGFIVMAMNSFGIIVAFKAEKIEKIFGAKNFFFYAALSSALLLILAALTSNLAIITAVLLLIMGIRLIRITFLSHYINQFVPSEKRATTMSTITMLASLLIAVFNPLIGWVMEASVDLASIVIGLALIAFAFSSRIEEGMLLG